MTTPEKEASVDEPRQDVATEQPSSTKVDESTLPPLTDTSSKLETTNPESAEAQSQPASGGGVTGFIKSIVFGHKEPTATEEAEGTTPVESGSAPVAESQPLTGDKTYEGETHDGKPATVHTLSDHSSVPTSLNQTSPSPVGVAKTQIHEPVSEFAPALTAIAGDAEAPDSTTRYGPALGALTGDTTPTNQPQSPSIIGSVTAAAGSAVESIKHAAGYSDETTPDSTTDTSTAAQPTSGGTIAVSELPKAGVVNTNPDGSVGVESNEKGYLAKAAENVSSGAQYVKDTVAGAIGTGQAGDTVDQVGSGPTTTPGVVGSTQGSAVSGNPKVEYEADPVPASVAKDTAGVTPSSSASQGATPAVPATSEKGVAASNDIAKAKETEKDTGLDGAKDVPKEVSSVAKDEPSKGVSAAKAETLPISAKEAPKEASITPASTGTETSTKATETPAASSPAGTKPSTSAFANQASGTKAKDGEIKEGEIAPASTGAKADTTSKVDSPTKDTTTKTTTTPKADATKKTTEAGKEKEKDKDGACCGCCVIS